MVSPIASVLAGQRRRMRSSRRAVRRWSPYSFQGVIRRARVPRTWVQGTENSSNHRNPSDLVPNNRPWSFQRLSDIALRLMTLEPTPRVLYHSSGTGVANYREPATVSNGEG